MKIEANAEPQVRQSGGRAELIVPIRFRDGRARLCKNSCGNIPLLIYRFALRAKR